MAIPGNAYHSSSRAVPSARSILRAVQHFMISHHRNKTGIHATDFQLVHRVAFAHDSCFKLTRLPTESPHLRKRGWRILHSNTNRRTFALESHKSSTSSTSAKERWVQQKLVHRTRIATYHVARIRSLALTTDPRASTGRALGPAQWTLRYMLQVQKTRPATWVRRKAPRRECQ